jgi:protein-S-isoprenylcysteine O-methyltransferase Ste14
MERERWTDLLIRAVVISCLLMVGWTIGRDLTAMIHRAYIDIAQLAARTSILAFNVLLAWLILIRTNPIARAKGWESRVAAVLGTNLFMFGVPLLSSRSDLPPSLYAASAVLIVLGCLSAIYSATHLGRSFSIMAQARRLVTDGPYRLVRHPLYVAEFISYVGVFLQYVSWTIAALLVIQSGIQIRRMFHEEALLQATFPEYAAYMARTSRMIPGVW